MYQTKLRTICYKATHYLFKLSLMSPRVPSVHVGTTCTIPRSLFPSSGVDEHAAMEAWKSNEHGMTQKVDRSAYYAQVTSRLAGGWLACHATALIRR